MIAKTVKGKTPECSPSAFIADNAVMTGDIVIGENANVWFGAVIRGDLDIVRVGNNSNIQDLTMVHTDVKCPTIIGDNVTIGHNSIIHGCIIEDNVLIGMGSTIMNRAKIGANTIIGAGSLIAEGKEIPSGVLAVGRPAKIIRELTQEEIAGITKSAEGYVVSSRLYMEE